MSSIFLSYDREDLTRAKWVALALENAGHSVWWDRHIKGGAQYSKEIEKALKEAEAVVVLWSERSVESAWVRDEAAAGRDSGRLVPVLLDGTEPPLGFRQFQTIDMSSKGRLRTSRLNELLNAVDALPSTPRAAPADTAHRKPPVKQPWVEKVRWPALAWTAAVVAVLVLAGVLWKPWRQPGTQLVVVVAADSTASSKRVARDFLVELGSLPMFQSGQIKLIDDAAGERPDLLFKVSAAPSREKLRASFVLVGRKDSAILWFRAQRL
ncbi:MAG: toll/interleukin-1 receptor domain-containing protein [Sphingomicrobium sp.]